jgi:hypothetical protein
MDANIQEAIQSQVHSAVSASQYQLLNSLTTLLNTRLNGFQRKRQETQKATSESQLGKITETMTETYKFRKRGNDEQYIHNQKVFVKMREVNAEIPVEGENISPANINSAKRKITEVMDLIRNRYVFSKVVREVVKHWRGRGLNIIMYLDDGLGGGKHLEYSLATHSAIKSDLERFGFSIAQEKCNWHPFQCLEWLGFVWDTSEGVIRITDKRLKKFLGIIEIFLNAVFIFSG